MEHSLGLMLPTAVDLFALTTCLGALGCRLWVLPPVATTMDGERTAALWAALWWLLALCLLLLIVSSLGELVGRTMTMSGRPLAASLRVLPTVLLRTHYGWVWCVRGAALVALWIGWGSGRRHLPSRKIPAVMLGAAALLALTRSASGHAADWGDVSLPELMDGLHLLAGSLWGGGLLVLTSTVLPVVPGHGPAAHAAGRHRPSVCRPRQPRSRCGARDRPLQRLAAGRHGPGAGAHPLWPDAPRQAVPGTPPPRPGSVEPLPQRPAAATVGGASSDQAGVPARPGHAVVRTDCPADAAGSTGGLALAA